ncbi:hypothetical protein SAMN04487931_106182 [Desulfobacula phenolica]|uniref:Uncharacterized protein n=1 Tax=Desulfobacula phenolica TaxID=90732 RepID=A0A1H2HDA3_9BACT|nr:hypothetical protein SAMN04487931_106182 [Desulfobacula phenolica]
MELNGNMFDDETLHPGSCCRRNDRHGIFLLTQNVEDKYLG